MNANRVHLPVQIALAALLRLDLDRDVLAEQAVDGSMSGRSRRASRGEIRTAATAAPARTTRLNIERLRPSGVCALAIRFASIASTPALAGAADASPHSRSGSRRFAHRQRDSRQRSARRSVRCRISWLIVGSTVLVRIASIMRPPDSTSVQRLAMSLTDVVVVVERARRGSASMRFWMRPSCSRTMLPSISSDSGIVRNHHEPAEQRRREHLQQRLAQRLARWPPARAAARGSRHMLMIRSVPTLDVSRISVFLKSM